MFLKNLFSQQKFRIIKYVLSDDERKVIRAIVQCSTDRAKNLMQGSQESVGSLVDATNSYTAEYGITQVRVKWNSVYITCRRPGIFIGKQGANLRDIQDQIEAYLERSVNIHLKEDNLTDYLYLYDPELSDD